MNRFCKAVDIINKGLFSVVMILMVAIAADLIIQVFSRFVFHNPVPWSDELARYMVVWMVFLASGLALKNGNLIGIEFLKNVVPDPIKKIFKIAGYLFQIAFILVVVYYGIQMVEITSVQASPILPINMSVVYAAVPVGMFFCLVNLFGIMAEDIILKKEA